MNPSSLAVALALALTLPLAAIHPLMAELVQALPLTGLALALAALAGAAWWIRPAAPPIAAYGFAAAALVLHPLYTWPLLLLFPLRGMARWRLVAASGLWILCLVVSGMRIAAVDGWSRLGVEGFSKVAEAMALGPIAVAATAWPLTTPVLGLRPLTDSNLGFAMALTAVILIATWRPTNASGSGHKVVLLLSVAVLMPLLANVFGRAHLGYYIGLIAMLALGWVVASTRLLTRFHRSGTRLKLALGLVCAMGIPFAYTSMSLRSYAEHWEVWRSEQASLAAIVSENRDSRYQWEYSTVLWGAGRRDDAITAGNLYLKNFPNDQARRESQALRLITESRIDDAISLIRPLLTSSGSLSLPREDIERCLEACEAVEDWDLFFRLMERVAPEDERSLLWLHAVARKAERKDKIEAAVSALQDRRSLSREAYERLYHHYRSDDDWGNLKSLGARALREYPFHMIGHLALGRAAKLVRNDDEMLKHYDAVLAIDPGVVEAHYDIALVCHGRKRDQGRAAAHYRRVLELNPTHPRRTMIESWVSQIEAAERISR